MNQGKLASFVLACRSGMMSGAEGRALVLYSFDHRWRLTLSQAATGSFLHISVSLDDLSLRSAMPRTEFRPVSGELSLSRC